MCITYDLTRDNIFLKNNQAIWNNRQDLLIMNPLKEMCDSVKFAHTGPFPIALLTHWSLVTFWKLFIQTYFIIDICHNLYPEESQMSILMSWEGNIGSSGCGLCIRQQAIIWPIVKQVHDAVWCPYASNEFSIYLTLSTLNMLMAWYFQYFGYQQAWH